MRKIPLSAAEECAVRAISLRAGGAAAGTPGAEQGVTMLHLRIPSLRHGVLLAAALASLVLVAVWPEADAGEPGANRLNALRAALREGCGRCHGAALRRPKGKFGFVTDLARLARTARYVVPGAPQRSLLYTQVATGKMPPPDGPVPPLDAAARAALHDWIAAGAPVPGGLTTPPADTTGTAAGAPPPIASGPPTLARRIGQFHPLLVHFPVALLLSALLAELLFVATGRITFAATARFCLVLGTVGALVAVTSGWFWSDASGLAATRHRWLAIATTAFALATCLLGPMAAARGTRGARLLYRTALLATVVLLVLTGYAGGRLTYGPDHYVPLA